jgi:hypothetical protein
MTLWELPMGYGRVKPDLVAPSMRLAGPGLGPHGACIEMSGTRYRMVQRG